MCQIYNVTFNICTLLFFIIFKSLRSSVSEGILAVDERMSKQEDIRKKKVRYGVYPNLGSVPCLMSTVGPAVPSPWALC
jgi:hypothetical protein